LKRQTYATTPALQYKYTCELLLLDYTDYEISGCKWGFIDEDNSGNMIAYCSACMEGYTPGEFASFSAVPMERLFKTCSKESTNPWGENCAYTGMTAANAYKCYGCSLDYVMNDAETECLDNKGGDPNCYKLNSVRDNCEICWWPFYFHDRVCLAAYGMQKIKAFVFI